MTDNPLIVTTEQVEKYQDDRKETKFWDGAGVLDSVEDLTNDAFVKKDLVGALIDGFGFAVDIAALIMDPFGSILSSVIGWIIEHVGFLREPFDALAGDPDEIDAAVATWQNIETALSDLATDHRDSLGQIAGWAEGPGSEAYREHAAIVGKLLLAKSAAAGAAANKLEIAGAAVKATRSLLRDLLADMASTLILWGVPAMAAAVPTLGASVATFITRAVTKAVEVGTKITKVLRKLFTILDDMGGLAKRAGEAATKLADKADDLAAQVTKNAPDIINRSVGRATGKVDDVLGKAEVPHAKAPEPKVNSKDEPDPSTQLGRDAKKVNDWTSRGVLDLENVARAVASGDPRHLIPKGGDITAPAKEFGKEFHDVSRDTQGHPGELSEEQRKATWRVSGNLNTPDPTP